MASSRMTPTPTPTSTASAANEATISRLNVGPMTTAFEPPARCFDRTLNSGVSTTLQQGGLEFADDLSMFITDIRSAEEICPSASIFPCLPHFRKYRELKGPHLFYSPGIACPKGWQTVASVMGSNTPNSLRYINGIVASTLLPGESAFICCPM
ncbi:hypothetical protein HIM_03121 [Hirsutella minnesotensis 3608]|nr:hypothetical protein HIM_03121 [Hirsutella minnesotensis 3608]